MVVLVILVVFLGHQLMVVVLVCRPCPPVGGGVCVFPFPPGGGGVCVFPFPPGGGGVCVFGGFGVTGGVLGNNLPKIKLNPPLNTQPPIVFAKLPIVPIKPRTPPLNIANIPPATANPVISSCFNFSSSFVFPSASARNSLSTLVVNHPPKRNSKDPSLNQIVCSEPFLEFFGQVSLMQR